jgi:hypothetical protein
VLLFTARRTISRVASGAALALAAVLLPIEIMLYFTLWLLGVAFSRVRIDCGTGVRCFWLAALAATCAYFRLTGDNDNFNQTTLGMDLIISLMFLTLLSSLQFNAAPASKLAPPLARIGKFFADFSFSLYVLHLPLIFVLQHVALTQFALRQLSPSEPLHFMIYLGMLCTLLLGSYLSYLLFESQTYRIRRIVKGMVARRAVAQPAAAAAAPAKH